MLDDKYRLRSFEELEGDPIPVSLVNEPIAPDNVATLVPRERSLHATLCESLPTCGRCGQSFAKKNLTWSRVARDILAIYHRVLSE